MNEKINIVYMYNIVYKRYYIPTEHTYHIILKTVILHYFPLMNCYTRYRLDNNLLS